MKLFLLLLTFVIYPLVGKAEEENRLNANALPRMVADTILESCRAHPEIRPLSLSAAQTMVNRCAYRVLNFEPVVDLTQSIITTEIFRQLVDVISGNRFSSSLAYAYAKKSLKEEADPELVETFEHMGDDNMITEEEERSTEKLKEQAPFAAGEFFALEGWVRAARIDEEMSYAAIRSFIANTPAHIASLPPTQRERYLEQAKERKNERVRNSKLLRMLEDSDAHSSIEQPEEVTEAKTVYKEEREQIAEWGIIESALLKETVDNYVRSLSFD